MTHVYICGGAPNEELLSFTNVQKEIWIGADYGAIHLLNHGVKPTLAIGDFDSITNDEWMQLQHCEIEIIRAPAEKDETDVDLAMTEALRWNPSKIILTGVTGGRLDHFYSALHASYRFMQKYKNIEVEIMNKTNNLLLLFPGKHTIHKHPSFRYVSFFSFDGVIESIRLQGWKYDVENEKIAFGETKFTSNEILEDVATISFTSGICLMIRSID